jgi:hypothetical protein
MQKYELYVFVPSVASAIVLYVTMFVRHGGAYRFERSSSFEQTLSFAIGLGFQALAVYLVIIWSREHNRTFDMPSSTW